MGRTLVGAWLVSAFACSWLAAQPLDDAAVTTEVEGLDGAKLALTHVTLSVTRDLEKTEVSKPGYSLYVSARLLVRFQLRDGRCLRVAVTKAKDETGKTIYDETPGLEFGLDDYMELAAADRGDDAGFHHAFSVNLYLPLRMPVPLALSLLEAECLMREPSDEITNACAFKTGEGFDLGPARVTIRSARVEEDEASFKAYYEMEAGTRVRGERSPLRWAVLDERGRAMGPIRYGLSGGGGQGRDYGKVEMAVRVRDDAKPAHISCTWPRGFAEKRVLLRIRHLPVPRVP